MAAVWNEGKHRRFHGKFAAMGINRAQLQKKFHLRSGDMHKTPDGNNAVISHRVKGHLGVIVQRGDTFHAHPIKEDGHLDTNPLTKTPFDSRGEAMAALAEHHGLLNDSAAKEARKVEDGAKPRPAQRKIKSLAPNRAVGKRKPRVTRPAREKRGPTRAEHAARVKRLKPPKRGDKRRDQHKIGPAVITKDSKNRYHVRAGRNHSVHRDPVKAVRAALGHGMLRGAAPSLPPSQQGQVLPGRRIETAPARGAAVKAKADHHLVQIGGTAGYRVWLGNVELGEVHPFTPRVGGARRWRAWDSRENPVGPRARGYATRAEAINALHNRRKRK